MKFRLNVELNRNVSVIEFYHLEETHVCQKAKNNSELTVYFCGALQYQDRFLAIRIVIRYCCQAIQKVVVNFLIKFFFTCVH